MLMQLRIFKVKKKQPIERFDFERDFCSLVMLQPQTAGQPDDRSKHKFMVQWVAVPNSYTDDVDNFVREKKIAKYD